MLGPAPAAWDMRVSSLWSSRSCSTLALLYVFLNKCRRLECLKKQPQRIQGCSKATSQSARAQTVSIHLLKLQVKYFVSDEIKSDRIDTWVFLGKLNE